MLYRIWVLVQKYGQKWNICLNFRNIYQMMWWIKWHRMYFNSLYLFQKDVTILFCTYKAIYVNIDSDMYIWSEVRTIHTYCSRWMNKSGGNKHRNEWKKYLCALKILHKCWRQKKNNWAKELRIKKSIPSLQSGQHMLLPNTVAEQ